MTNLLDYELTIGRHRYVISRMSTYEQMQIACDYRDILTGLAMLKKNRPKDFNDADYRRTVNMIITSRAGMDPEARARVWDTCLSKIKRGADAVGGGIGWSSVLVAPGTLAFDDIQPADMIALLYESFEHNKLLDFFSEGLSNSAGPTT